MSRAVDITSPHDRRVIVGTCRSADPPAIDRALSAAKSASHDWDALGGEARAAILDRAADLFEADRATLMGLMVREAGKTLGNAQGDLREAVDHLRYAAAEARRSFAAPLELKGPTGERNELSLAWARRVRLHLALELSRLPFSPGSSRARSLPAMPWWRSRRSRRRSPPSAP